MDNHFLMPTRSASSSLSIMQAWLLHMVQLNSAAPIHTTVAIELIGRLNRRALRTALDYLIYRHQVLRTVFRQVNGGWLPFVGPADRGLALLEQDVATEQEAFSLLREEARAPFCVSTGPLVRARLLQLGPTHHFLLVSAHPLVSDRASLVFVFSELREVYGVSLIGRSHSSPPAAQYSDFTLQQFATLTPSVLQEELSYWKRQLLGAQDLVRLPIDRPRPAMQVYAPQKHRLELSEELTRELSKLASCRNIPLLVVLLGGWSVLLHRWSGQRDFTIGVQVSNRWLGSADSVIGPFENTLPVRVEILPSTTVSALLAQVDDTLSAATANKDIPIHAVDQSLRPLRDGRPVIQTALSLSQTSLEAAVGGAFASGELEVARVWEERCQSMLEVSISLLIVGGRLMAVVEYARELFEKRTIERVCGWWISLFSAMVETPGLTVSQLPMLTASERESVITEFNRTCSSSLQPQRIDDLLESHAELTPDSLAAVDRARALSFSELNGLANQLARILKRRGVHSGELVAVIMDPGIDAIVAVIAVLKVGGAYIAGAPAEFQSSMFRTLRDHAPRKYIVATQAAAASWVNDEQIIALDADAEAIGRESMENAPRRDATARDLACAVLSADHKGRCCWMLLEHREVTSMVASLDERLHFTQFDVWSLSHSMSSGISLVELWGALLYGSQVTIVPAGATRDPEGLCHFLAESGITVLNQKPGEFLRWMGMTRAMPRHRLHTLILSGEPLRAAELKAWFDVGRCWPQVIYLYGHRGPVVAGAYSKVTQRDVLRRSGCGLAGAPLSCSRFYVLDRHLQPVPIGVVGDIYVASDSNALGYVESRQHRKCVPDPFGVDPNSKLYKTGDQGFWSPEGQIELILPSGVARSADVEASRIENELLSHPAVSKASVVVSPNTAGGDSFVAYVEGSHRAPSASELRTYLELNLPAYMVPKEFIVQGNL